MGKLANLMAEPGHSRFGNLGNVEQNPNCGPSPLLLGEDWNAKIRPICLWFCQTVTKLTKSVVSDQTQTLNQLIPLPL